MILALIIFFSGCSRETISEIPKGYIYDYEYHDGGWQDFTYYEKYIYPNADKFINNDYYRMISVEDIDNIKGYFENFKYWIKNCDEYDFNDSIINAGDYVMIKTLEGQPIGQSKYGKYDNYHVYFFDIETNTLFYIHANI